MEDPPLCANGCGFFGTLATRSLCSRCYRDFLKEEEEEATKAKTKSMEKAMASIVVPTPSCNDVASSMARLSLSSENTDKIIRGDDSSTKKKVERCEKCKKNVGIIRFECRCRSMFCEKHRLPENHECSFDYKTMGREILMKQNPLLRPDKLRGRF